MKIILYGEPVVPFVELLKNRLSSNFEILPMLYEDSVLFNEEIKNTNVLITVRLNTDVSSLKNIKLVQCTGIGIDEIKTEFIPPTAYLCNVGEHENAMAEFVLLSVLSLNWKLIHINDTFRKNDWHYSSRMGGLPAKCIEGKNFGIVGYGNVGQAIAKKLKLLGGQISVCSRSKIQDKNVIYFNYLNIHNMAESVDYLIIACDVRQDTIDMINSKVFESMRKNSYLINVARGIIVNEKDLYYALLHKKIAGAFIDVWYQYPNQETPYVDPSRYPIHKLENVYISPHIAGWTEETVQKRWDIISSNIIAISNNTMPKNVLNK